MLYDSSGTGGAGGLPYPAASPQEQQQHLSTATADQLEQLLLVSHSMPLQPLTQRLHRFITSNAADAAGTALLYGVLDLVFSPRVVTAALGPAAADNSSPAAAEARRAWTSSVLTQPEGFFGGNQLVAAAAEAAAAAASAAGAMSLLC